MIITRTPLRISLFGGGTDIPRFHQETDGAVFAMAIDKYVYVMLKDKFDKRIRVSYSITENVDKIREIKNELIRETILHTKIKSDNGLEVVTVSDVPSNGSGMGSSSALCVGLLGAIVAKAAIEREERPFIQKAILAKHACEVELNRMSKPIGKQDQYTCALGGVVMHIFHKDVVTSAPIDRLRIWNKEIMPYFMLLHIGPRGDFSADRILEAAPNPDKSLVETMASHARTMYALSVGASPSSIISSMGDLLKEAWACKKLLTPLTTNQYIDNICEIAIKLGARGVKILGAGGGGFLLVFADPDQHTNIAEGLGLTRIPFEIDGAGVTLLGGEYA